MANNALEPIKLLIEAGTTDAVYRDVYLRRARQLLHDTLDESGYRAIGSMQYEIEALVRRTRSAVLQHDWAEVRELSLQADQMRKTLDGLASVAAVGKHVYDAETLVLDSFSPGKHLGLQGQMKQPELRAKLLDTLSSLGKLDSSMRGFYEDRRNYFSALQIVAGARSQDTAQQSRGQLEQLALEAAERGDMPAVRSLAEKLRDYKDEGVKGAGNGTSALKTCYASPTKLDQPFPADTNPAAREFGLVEKQFTVVPEMSAALEVIYTHAWDPPGATPELEREGVLRSEVLLESKTPAQFLNEDVKFLAEQFLRQIFINSGGARYLPPMSAETALVEDFEESQAADAPSKLLGALRLPHRRALARTQIEQALMSYGAQTLADEFHLDPIEYRLICIPYDMYWRLGRERNWGQWHHWTHFDGYQVVQGNRLRALVGGDGRFGGINDLVSISSTDARDNVYVRFAVVRRARMVARWR